jgi:glycosyltransferase involved in cell wall biosynthesis
MPTICFLGNPLDTFIKNDCISLRNIFDINIVDPPRKFSDWIKFPWTIYKNIRKSDLTYCWFAGTPSAIAIIFSKIFGKKTIVVVGGWDAAYYPDLNYGAFIKFKDRIPVKFVYKNVDKILVVAPFLKDDIIKYAKIKGENIEFLPTGFDINFWIPKGKKEKYILTSVKLDDLTRMKLKGLDTFVQSAKYLKNQKFILIGVWGKAKDHLKKIAPKNVEFIDFIPQKELLKYYQKAKVYCQLSIREGLPTSLCEAMLCECIPVGSKIPGCKTAMGDIGFFAEYADVKQTAESIKKALEADEKIGKQARERVKKLYSDEKRNDTLQKMITKMIK